MKNSFKTLLGGALLLALPMFLTSCEDILGEWDKPAPVNTIVTPDDNGGGTSTENTYLVWDATAKQLKSEALPTTYTKMDASQTTWSGTYIVEDDVEITSDVTLSGDATIIIKDGKTLSLASDKKIEYVDVTAYKLNIHAQSDGASAGKLVVNTTSADTHPIAIKGSLSIYGASVSTTATGADSEGIYVAGELNVYGGEIKSTATLAGIMVDNVSGGTVNIYGGTVDAKTTSGVGSRAIYVIGNMNIYNGTVKGTASGTGTGISVTGAAPGMGTLTIENGSVTGKGGDGLEGINANTINISGGTVTAENGMGDHGALQCTDLTISGDETIVNATGGENTGYGLAGFGIKSTNSITINGGKVTAKGGNANGSHGGKGIKCTSNIIINGGSVTATGGNSGGTEPGASGIEGEATLTINGGTVTATGGNGTGTGKGGVGIAATTTTVTACTKVTSTGGDGTTKGECFSGTVTPANTLKYSWDDGANYTNSDGSAQDFSTKTSLIIIPQ